MLGAIAKQKELNIKVALLKHRLQNKSITNHINYQRKEEMINKDLEGKLSRNKHEVEES